MAGWDALREVDPMLSSLDVWALPAPLDGMAWLAVQALRVVAAVLTTATLNVATLGPAWPVGYWATVLSLLWLGGRGASGGAAVFRGGEDVSSFSGGRASWLGFAAGVIRLQVRARAQVSAAAVVVGYGGAAALLVVGVLWWWLLPMAAMIVAVVWQTQARQRWWIDP